MDGRNVIMDNDETCQVVGIESVHSKIHDKMVRAFRDVRHVSCLKKNLISLVTLDVNKICGSCEVE